MVHYLSPEWLAEAEQAAKTASGLAEATAGVSLSVQQVVTGGPHGDVTYHVHVRDGALSVSPGATDNPTVTFEQDYPTAVSVAKGELSAQGAFMTGRIRVRGDLPRLVEYQEALSRVDDVFRTLRDRTQF
ncbi:MAG: SCP2 sterol-binding domain-containing protein [Acidimicrobiales bacterium]